MSPFLVAVADSVFPNLDPAREVLSTIGADLQLAPQATPEAILKIAARRRRAAGDLREDHGGHDRADDALPDHLALRHRRRQRRPRRGDRARASSSRRCPTTASTRCPITRWRCCWPLARKIPLSNAQVHAGRWEMPAVVPIHRLRGSVLGLVGLRPDSAAGRAEGEGVRPARDRLRPVRAARTCLRARASSASSSRSC